MNSGVEGKFSVIGELAEEVRRKGFRNGAHENIGDRVISTFRVDGEEGGVKRARGCQ